jgi:uncharacterized protein (TIGR03435 family)
VTKPLVASIERYNGISMSVSHVADSLSATLGRVVVNKTGLTGIYDFDLRWAPDESVLRGLKDRDPDEPPPELDGPSIFTAVQEQLGLELKATKGPVQVLVVDHATQPEAN